MKNLFFLLIILFAVSCAEPQVIRSHYEIHNVIRPDSTWSAASIHKVTLWSDSSRSQTVLTTCGTFLPHMTTGSCVPKIFTDQNVLSIYMLRKGVWKNKREFFHFMNGKYYTAAQ